MSAAALLDRAYFGRNADKKAAIDCGVSVWTVRWWRRHGFPKGREEQVRRVLEERLEEQAREIQITLDQIRGADASTHRMAAAAAGRSAKPIGAEDQP